MNPQNNTQPQRTSLVSEEQIPPGTIKPKHLAAATTMKAGDIYYVGTDGIFHRLAIGTAGQSLKVGSNGLPQWA